MVNIRNSQQIQGPNSHTWLILETDNRYTDQTVLHGQYQKHTTIHGPNSSTWSILDKYNRYTDQTVLHGQYQTNTTDTRTKQSYMVNIRNRQQIHGPNSPKWSILDITQWYTYYPQSILRTAGPYNTQCVLQTVST